MLIDTHVHLDDKKFDGDRNILIENLKNNNVELVINIAADLQTSVASVDLANKYDNVYAAIGVHPHSAKEVNTMVMEQLRELAQNEKVIAIGEIGLDYFYDNSPRDVQRKWFIEQLKLAKELDLPIIIHTRDAAGETFEILKNNQNGNVKGVLHSYSGSPEMALEYIKMGFYIALGGPVTFKNARVVREVAEAVPLDKLLLETDCPYLTPEPYRGKRNEPVYVKYVAEKIAEVKGVTYEQLVKATNANAKKLFGIK